MKILSTNLESKKDIINAQNSSAVLKDVIGNPMMIYGYVVYSETSADGKEQVVTSIKTENGFVGSTSDNVRSTVEAVASTFGAEDFTKGIPFVVRSATSKNGRQFLTVELV